MTAARGRTPRSRRRRSRRSGRSMRRRSTTSSRASGGPSPGRTPARSCAACSRSSGTLVGYAVTSEWTGGEPDAPNEDYLELLELIESMPKPVVSVLVDVGSRPGRSGIAGDGMMREFQVLGAAGAVVAGSIIDIAGMEKLSFPVYATGVVPAYDDMRMAGFGQPVDVGPLRVVTGDLLVADRTGVLRVPVDAADAVIAGLPGFRALEASVAELLDRPGLTAAQMRAWYEENEPAFLGGDLYVFVQRIAVTPGSFSGPAQLIAASAPPSGRAASSTTWRWPRPSTVRSSPVARSSTRSLPQRSCCPQTNASSRSARLRLSSSVGSSVATTATSRASASGQASEISPRQSVRTSASPPPTRTRYS